jgi:hypothetical protein
MTPCTSAHPGHWWAAAQYRVVLYRCLDTPIVQIHTNTGWADLCDFKYVHRNRLDHLTPHQPGDTMQVLWRDFHFTTDGVWLRSWP